MEKFTEIDFVRCHGFCLLGISWMVLETFLLSQCKETMMIDCLANDIAPF